MVFESTIWTQIKKAKDNDTTALNDFVLKYRDPIIRFIINKGFSSDEAEDLAQEIFTTIFQDNILKQADQSKGKFRSLILAVTKNVIRNEMEKKAALKRDANILPMDKFDTALFADDSHNEDTEFDTLWTFNIIKIALDKLRTECKIKEVPYYEVLDMYANQELDYKDIAERMNLDINNVKKYIFRARTRLREYIKQEVLNYSSSNNEYTQELMYLDKFLRGI